MKIGLIGGAFDPIHFGHLNASEEIAEVFGLHRVIFIPVSSSPHKTRRLTDVRHRLNMTMLGVLSNPVFEVSDMEIKRGGVSYTIDTIREIKKQLGGKTDFFFITGSDAFYDIGEWRDARYLFEECHFIVDARPGFGIENIEEILKKRVTAKLGSPHFRFKKKEKSARCAKLAVSDSYFEINVVTTTCMDISSTLIRENIRQGKSVRYMVPYDVECYIRKEGLYK